MSTAEQMNHFDDDLFFGDHTLKIREQHTQISFVSQDLCNPGSNHHVLLVSVQPVSRCICTIILKGTDFFYQ